MMIGVGCEFVVGVAALVAVPLNRSNGWLPPEGELVYLIHAALGAVLTLAALGLVLVAPRERLGRTGVFIGLAGLAVAAAGGMMAAFHPARFAGLVLMLVGTMAALVGYLLPLAERPAVSSSTTRRR